MERSGKTKAQPWKSQWPAPCDCVDNAQTGYVRPTHGFLKGQEIVMDGNTFDVPLPTATATAAPSVQELLIDVSRKVFEAQPVTVQTLQIEHTESRVRYSVAMAVLLCALVFAWLQGERLRKALA